MSHNSKGHEDESDGCNIELVFCMKSGTELRVVANVEEDQIGPLKYSVLKQICTSENRWFVFEECADPMKEVVISISEIECVKIENKACSGE